MCFKTFFVTDISSVDNEGGLLVGGIVAHIIHPVFVMSGVEYLGVRDVDESVWAIFTYARIIGD